MSSTDRHIITLGETVDLYESHVRFATGGQELHKQASYLC